MSKKSRAEANGELIAILSDYLETNPDIRFSQALVALGLVNQVTSSLEEGGFDYWEDMFYLESVDLLEIVKEKNGI